MLFCRLFGSSQDNSWMRIQNIYGIFRDMWLTSLKLSTDKQIQKAEDKRGGRCLAWYDASLGRWRPLVRIRPTPHNILNSLVKMIPVYIRCIRYIHILHVNDNCLSTIQTMWTFGSSRNAQIDILSIIPVNIINLKEYC